MLIASGDDIDVDFASKVWMEDRQTRASTEDADIHQVSHLVAFQGTFRMDHERSFWVERVIPFFKYLGSMSRVVFSWYSNTTYT